MAKQLTVKPLDSLERSTLRGHEKTIDNGCHIFIEVGAALMEIREGKLYREDHKTFKAYCENRWGFSDSRARQLIGGAEVAKNVKSVTRVTLSPGPSGGGEDSETVTPVTPASEKQTRPLAQLPEAQQGAAWLDAVELAGGKQPTGTQVQEAVNAYLEPEEEDEPDEDTPLPDEPEEESIENIVTNHNKAIESFCQRVRKAANARPEDIAWLDDKGRWDGYFRKVCQGLDTLRSAKAVVCPACNGDRCKQCDDYGFLPKLNAEGISG